jgi:hypothetical protein
MRTSSRLHLRHPSLCGNYFSHGPPILRLRFMTPSPIDAYRRQIERELRAGNPTEHTHRPALKSLVESLASGVTATNEPRRVECGAPDYIVTRKAQHGPATLGYIEAKDVGKPLDDVERSDQLKRYLPALPNLMLTDYLEFRDERGGDGKVRETLVGEETTSSFGTFQGGRTCASSSRWGRRASRT